MPSVWVTGIPLRLFRGVVRFRVESAVVIVGIVGVEEMKAAAVVVTLLVAGPSAECGGQ